MFIYGEKKMQLPFSRLSKNMFTATSPALMASSSLAFLSKPSLLLRPLRSPFPRFTCSISSSSSSSSSSFEFDISFAPPPPKPKPESGVSRLDQFVDAGTGRQLFIPWIVRGEDGNLTLQSQPPTSYLHALAESEAKPKKKKDSTGKSAVQPKLSKAARRFYNENFRDSSQRLSKVLAAAGVASRRSSEELIFDGKVTVNGSVCNTPQTRVDPARDVIYVNGNRLPKKLPPKVYLALNKPKGYICSSGEKESKSVMSLFDDYLKSWDKINQGQPKPRLFTVGRLDVATTGLIIVTNDGDFAQSLSHPSSNLSKEYIATIDGDVSKRHLVAISEGTFIDSIQCIPDSVELLPRQPDMSRPRLRIVVHEGRNHEVRELVKNAGLEVKEDSFPGILKGWNTENMHSLKRVRIGGYRLPSDLGLGKHIELRQSDLKTLNWRN